MRTIWIGLAGFAGAVSRYEVEGWVTRWTKGAFPWGTVTVNMSGCFFLGFMLTVFMERFLPHPDLRAALTIGFIGSYTTFSTFAYETLRLGQGRATGLALLNALVSVAAGVAAVWLGTILGRLV